MSCKDKKLLQKYINIATLQKEAILLSVLNGRFFYTLKEKQHVERYEIFNNKEQG